MNIKKILCLALYFFMAIALLYILNLFLSSYKNTEGLTNTTCAGRSSCSACLDGHDSTGSTCYWCKTKGCVDPDVGDYDPNTCSSDKTC